MKTLDFFFSLTHNQIMYYSILFALLVWSVAWYQKLKGAVLGDDDILQINEIFQLFTIYGVVVYALECWYYEMEFDLKIFLAFIVFAITGEIRDAVKILTGRFAEGQGIKEQEAKSKEQGTAAG